MRMALRTTEAPELRRELLYWRSGATIGIVAVVLGALQGWFWSLVAPGEQFKIYTDGQHLPLPTESYHQFTDIAIFVLVGGIAGVVLATAAWYWRSVRGLTTLLVLTLANAVGALVAYLLGRVLVSGVDPALVGATGKESIVSAAPILGNAMVIVAQPAIAVAVYTFLVAWNGRPNLERPTGTARAVPADSVDLVPLELDAGFDPDRDPWAAPPAAGGPPVTPRQDW